MNALLNTAPAAKPVTGGLRVSLFAPESNTPTWSGSFAEFLMVNRFSPAVVRQMAHGLQAGKSFHIGGGAAPEFRVERENGGASASYADRVRALEAEGMSTSDAQACCDLEDRKGGAS